MKNIKILPFCFAVLFCFLGSCKVYRDVENLKPSYSKEAKAGSFASGALTRLIEGDQIQVKTKSGETYYMNYKQIHGQNLFGTVWKVDKNKIPPIKAIEIPIAEIEEVRVKRLSIGATSLFVVGAAGVAFGILLLITFGSS